MSKPSNPKYESYTGYMAMQPDFRSKPTTDTEMILIYPDKNSADF